MSNIHQSAEQAADAIIALINASPTTPRRDELAGIISTVAAPMKALSPEHLAYRELRAEVDRYCARVERSKESEDYEAEINALLERVSDMEKTIWATPATTLADLLLRAEIAENNENGAMDDLDNPDAYLDDRAFAQLIRAALDVLGGHHAS